MNAYDYEKQAWVSGEEARRVRAEQIREELALLKGPRGAEYLRFSSGRTGQVSRPVAIATLEKELAGLEGDGRIPANARLIAAAPELLAACELALKCADDHGADHFGFGEYADNVRDAIKKARGQ